MGWKIKNDLLIPLIITAGLWLTVNVCIFFDGLAASWMDNESCKDNLARIEYIFPGYQFGCWMGEK